MTKPEMHNSVSCTQRGEGVKPSVLMMAYTNYETDARVIRAAEAALKGGFSVDVLSLRREGQLPIEGIRGIRVIRLGQEKHRGSSHLKYLLSYLEFFIRCLITSTRLFAAKRYKAIHVHNMPDMLVFAAIIPKFLGSKVILDIHDPMPETYGSKFGNVGHSLVGRFLLLLEKLSVAFANATLTVSEPLKRGILIKHGYLPEAIDVIANFADDQIFRPMAYPPVKEKVRFVFHGTILERYGLRTLVDAVCLVRSRNKIHIKIIGEGDFSTTFASLVKSHQVGDVIEFINHVYPVHEIPGILSDCHVGLVPLDISASTVANFALPLKLVEYTCLGMPTVTVRNAAIEYYLRPDECMYFDSGDARGLAQILDAIAMNPDCLVAYSEKVRVARERMLWTKERERYITMLRKLTGVNIGQRIETSKDDVEVF
jgi:glycosyltransferase involved in cell wall biosynthesis